jgi:hypothetical protein
MTGGVFQGANDPSFTSPTTLFTITAAPAYNTLTPQLITVSNAFRYVRYLSPNNGWCNVAEVEFWGRAALPPLPAAPIGVAAVAGDGVVNLNWNASANATGYKVKRSLVSGGAYSPLASTGATNYADASAANGTWYFYVVTATNLAGESGNSLGVTARPVSQAPINVGWTRAGGQLELAWPADHLGWSLQVQTNSLSAGFGANWTTIPNSATTNQLSLPIDPGVGGVFFRLIYP